MAVSKCGWKHRGLRVVSTKGASNTWTPGRHRRALSRRTRRSPRPPASRLRESDLASCEYDRHERATTQRASETEEKRPTATRQPVFFQVTANDFHVPGPRLTPTRGHTPWCPRLKNRVYTYPLEISVGRNLVDDSWPLYLFRGQGVALPSQKTPWAWVVPISNRFHAWIVDNRFNLFLPIPPETPRRVSRVSAWCTANENSACINILTRRFVRNRHMNVDAA